jgi:RNA polymerase sigma-70 factor (ECF subfamily)
MDRTGFERATRFSAAYAAFHGRVWAFAARRVGGAAADDVTAETFLIAWQKFERLPSDPLPWLYGVARNVVLRHLATGSREDGIRNALALERAASEDAGEDPRVWEAWAALSDRDREVLALVAWEQLRVRDGARVLGITPAVFSVRLHRARKRLERLLAEPSAAVSTPTRSKAA